MNIYVKYTKKPKLYYFTSDGLKINKRAMALVAKKQGKRLPRLNKVWVEGKGLVDIPSP